MTSESQKPVIPPAWLRWFVNDASRGIIDHGTLAPIGCHFFHDQSMDVWEVTLFVSVTELVGGPGDGKRVPTGLQVDINRVTTAFDSDPATYWQSEALEPDDELGNHLSFEGVARGHHVWLRIVEKPPGWAGPGRVLHTAQGFVEDLW